MRHTWGPIMLSDDGEKARSACQRCEAYILLERLDRGPSLTVGVAALIRIERAKCDMTFGCLDQPSTMQAKYDELRASIEKGMKPPPAAPVDDVQTFLDSLPWVKRP